MRKKNLKIPFIYSSSDKAYGELEKKFYLENDKLNAIFPYDTSKSSSDLICQSYSKTYNLNVGIIRSANIFGPNDLNTKRIVPETIISILSNKKLNISLQVKAEGLYLYEDVTRAYFKLFKYLEKKWNLKIYNIGSKYNLSTIQIIKKIYKIMKIKENFEIKNFLN